MISATPHPWQAYLESRATQKTYRQNETILYQSDVTDTVGFILSGRAKATAYSEQGEQTWLGEFEAGQFFGHVSFLTRSPIKFEIVAQTDVTALIVPVSAIQACLDDSHEFGQAVAKDLAGRLDAMIVRLIEALTLSAKGRVCAELIRLSCPIGISPDKHIVRPNPVFVDVALRVNSTRETVSRTVSELQKKGIISRQPGALVIEKFESLKNAVL